MKTRLLIAMAAIILTGCKTKIPEADAYGNFEATEVIVSAETSGRIMEFPRDEGSRIEHGELIAVVDTTISHLQKNEIDAGMNSVKTRISTIISQNEILNQQIENQNVNIARIEKMLKDDAATQKQLDDLTGQVAVLKNRLQLIILRRHPLPQNLEYMHRRKQPSMNRSPGVV